MPRPKVSIDKRKRVVQACVRCRNSKKRCNAQQPCSNCVRKGMAGSCTFEDVSQVDPVVSTAPVSHTRRTRRDYGAQQTLGQIRSPATTVGTQASSPEASHRTQPRMLDNARGEKVFFGGSASLAFLQYIRDTVSPIMGKSKFSHDAEQNHMLEGPRTRISCITQISVTCQQEDAFVNLFLVATPGLLDLFTKQQVLDLLRSYRDNVDSLNSLECAIVRTILAVGAQCSECNTTNLSFHQSYFASAQREAFAGMIEDPCLEMVELFLLMAFYMLGACHRNAAFMYIGVAARAAYALGLHVSFADIKPTRDANRQQRVRTIWKCLVTLDTIVSSILGRPSAISSQLSELQDWHKARPEGSLGTSAALQANYELACLMDRKVQELYNAEKVTTEGVRMCLDELSDWSSRLPPGLRLVLSNGQNAPSHGNVIGGLHVSCFYYFAVMLVSRPFLIVYLTRRLASNRAESGSFGADELAVDDESEMREIAEACLHAATYMIQTCMETHTNDFLPENMRVLKAWVFAAGLVLGFEMFTSDRSELDIETAFRDSNDILKKLAIYSPQAAHNSDIITSLSDTIAIRRRQSLTGRKQNPRPIVAKIMSFQSPQMFQQSTNTIHDSAIQDESSVIDVANGSVQDGENWAPNMDFDFDFQTMMDDPFLNWENADFLAWDPFATTVSV